MRLIGNETLAYRLRMINEEKEEVKRFAENNSKRESFIRQRLSIKLLADVFFYILYP
jgi:hypothetical protein